jgi:perosamine synthetase
MSGVLTRYQDAFAARLGVGQAFGFWKGRVALYALLRGLGIGEGDEVIMPGYTCVMAVNPIVYLGARPVFVDVEPATFNIDPNRIEPAITPRTKLIIAQHTYGYPADLDAILDITRRKGLPFIEDCCLALGSTYRGRLLGTFGQGAYFSFQWNKPYTTGLGGMAVTSDDAVADRIRKACEREMALPSFKQVAMLAAQLAVYRSVIYPRTTILAQTAFRWLSSKGLAIGSSSASEMGPRQQPGFFKGMSRLQARSGLRQLRRWDRTFDHRRRMQRLYNDLLARHGWSVTRLPEHVDPVLVRYPVRVADKERALATAGSHFVELGSWFECPLHPIETRLEDYGYKPGMCPEAERASREVVNLPLHPRANEATARRTVEFITGIGQARATQDGRV